jgi:hypothetical protein
MGDYQLLFYFLFLNFYFFLFVLLVSWSL